jgi:hypothetical protein
VVGAVILGAGLTLGATATAAVPLPMAKTNKGGNKGAAKTKQVAQAKVEVKTDAGAVLKSHLNLDWGSDGTVELAAGDNKHAVGLRVVRNGDGSDITITLSYGVDGSPIIEPYTFDSSVGKREVITIEDGGAIALTVTSQQVKDDEPPPAPPPDEPDEDKGKIEVKPDVDDPLGGLE